MNGYKLLHQIAIGSALIMGGYCTAYAASESVDGQSLSTLANRVDAAQSASSAAHKTTSSTTTQHTQEGAGNTSSSVSPSAAESKVIVPKALVASAPAPVSTEQNHEIAHSSDTGGKTDASKPEGNDGHSSSQANTPPHPDLTPTGYIEALIAPLSVAKDLGKNCQQVLSSNTGDQDICDQFDRAVDNLAQDQAKIEKTTPRPKDTKSVAPELMSQFNELSQQLNQEVQYLRAYRATQK